ncbi:plastocyanin/azurin family copper-binding protein [Haloarchaeobius sp. TZWWS8]|uniref:plastocyanin/azurin family copper-binding protein n=1 Tax=Haloarchaeobius sp. TZWWS8 TaxID=3446121 RepID=UPI003EBA6157
MHYWTEPTRRGFCRGIALGGAGLAGTGVVRPVVAQEGTTHTVEMTDTLVFEPKELVVAPRDTVRWVNVGNVGHSVTAYEKRIPETAVYFASGGFRFEAAARNNYPKGEVASGERYQHTFEELGTYEYFCIPHEGAGMVGSVEVREGGAAAAGPVESILPDSAKTLGIALVSTMLAVLGLIYVFLRFGGNYREEDEGRRGAV